MASWLRTFQVRKVGGCLVASCGRVSAWPCRAWSVSHCATLRVFGSYTKKHPHLELTKCECKDRRIYRKKWVPLWYALFLSKGTLWYGLNSQFAICQRIACSTFHIDHSTAYHLKPYCRRYVRFLCRYSKIFRIPPIVF